MAAKVYVGSAHERPQVNIEDVLTRFKPSQICPEAVQESVETAVELGKWFHQSFYNTVHAPKIVDRFRRQRENMIALPRPCAREAAALISHATRAHVRLGRIHGTGFRGEPRKNRVSCEARRWEMIEFKQMQATAV